MVSAGVEWEFHFLLGGKVVAKRVQRLAASLVSKADEKVNSVFFSLLAHEPDDQ